MSGRPFYRLVRIEPRSPSGGLSTAAVLSCAACGAAISGSGGPGEDEICEDCGDSILDHRRPLVEVRGTAITDVEAKCLAAISDWKAPYEVERILDCAYPLKQVERCLRRLVRRGMAQYGPSQDTYRAKA